MLRWLHRLLDRRYGAHGHFSPLSQAQWEGLLVELADGLERHKPVFEAIQHMLYSKEREAFDLPRAQSPQDLELWRLEQYGVVREANMLRRVFRLPLEGARLKARHAKQEKAKEEAARRPAPVDLE